MRTRECWLYANMYLTLTEQLLARTMVWISLFLSSCYWQCATVVSRLELYDLISCATCAYCNTSFVAFIQHSDSAVIECVKTRRFSISLKYVAVSQSRVWRPTPHVTHYFGDESFPAIDCTGTVKLTIQLTYEIIVYLIFISCDVVNHAFLISLIHAAMRAPLYTGLSDLCFAQ